MRFEMRNQETGDKNQEPRKKDKRQSSPVMLRGVFPAAGSKGPKAGTLNPEL